MKKYLLCVAFVSAFLTSSAFALPQLCYSIKPSLVVSSSKISTLCFGKRHTYNNTVDTFLIGGKNVQIEADFHFGRNPSENADWITLPTSFSNPTVLEIFWQGPHFPDKRMEQGVITAANGESASLSRITR